MIGQLAEDLGAGLAAEDGISGCVATEISQSSDKPMPMTTPARTPNTRVPRIAAMAIQKSKRCTRRNRRISATFIIPITTASMINAASTGLGRSENKRRQDEQGQEDHDA